VSAARPVRKGRDESGRSTAERLLDAALESFASRGFEATSLDDLATELGVRKQTILYYHRSKEALLGAVIDRVVADLVVAFDEAIAAAPATSDRPSVVVDTVFRLGASRPEVLALLWQVARSGAPASGRLAAGVQPMFEHLVGYLAGPGRAAARRREQVRRAVLGAAARVLGLAVEVEMRRELGVAADLAWLRRRRADLLGELRG
jgi:AcrR family transcriptional regulator